MKLIKNRRNITLNFFLDKLLEFTHLFLIIFNLFGWVSKKTRTLHLITILSTLFFWFIIGIWYGLGYCPLTDYHWTIKQEMGETELPSSYIKYILDYLFNKDFSPDFINYLTVISTLTSLTISLFLTFKKGHKVPKWTKKKGSFLTICYIRALFRPLANDYLNNLERNGNHLQEGT